MARSQLMRVIQLAAARWQRDAWEADASPAQRATARAHAETRRECLRRALALGAAGLVPPLARASFSGETGAGPRVVIVGGGLAGLAAAWELAQAGVRATLFEAAPRVGGRCWTERRAFAEGQIAERGGELIDTSHEAIIDLTATFGLPLDDLLAAEPRGSEARWIFDNAPYPLAAATADLQRLLPRLDADARALEPALPTYRRSTAAQRALDRMSAADWIASRVDGGPGSRFAQLLANAYVEELGGDLAEINAITVVALLHGTPRDRFSPYEESDQRFHIRGGNDALVAALAGRAGDAIQTGARLTALARMPDGRVRLTTARDAATRDEIADRVILALPFSLLREVDLARAGFRPRKLAAIRDLGMGRNTKLQLQFHVRAWRAANGNGETRVSGAYLTSWEVTRAQVGAAGILNFFSGGTLAARAGDDTPEQAARRALADLERCYPGIGTTWNGKVIRNAWDRHPWSRGSYSLLKPGQYTAFHGVEWEPEGPVCFAGEHASEDSSGYLNGAVESGQRAARETLAALRAPARRRAA
jgi:monoamine oxidase